MTAVGRKVTELLVVALASVLDPLTPREIPLQKLAAAFYLAIEAGQLIAKADRAGVPVPPVLERTVEMLVVGHQKVDKNLENPD